MGPELGKIRPAGTRAGKFSLCHSVFLQTEWSKIAQIARCNTPLVDDFFGALLSFIFCKNISDPNRDPAGAAMVTWIPSINGIAAWDPCHH